MFRCRYRTLDWIALLVGQITNIYNNTCCNRLLATYQCCFSLFYGCYHMPRSAAKCSYIKVLLFFSIFYFNKYFLLQKVLYEAVSICKKCLTPKPIRTHHCSVCNRCVLKMDHHCRK